MSTLDSRTYKNYAGRMELFGQTIGWIWNFFKPICDLFNRRRGIRLLAKTISAGILFWNVSGVLSDTA